MKFADGEEMLAGKWTLGGEHGRAWENNNGTLEATWHSWAPAVAAFYPPLPAFQIASVR